MADSDFTFALGLPGRLVEVLKFPHAGEFLERFGRREASVSCKVAV